MEPALPLPWSELDAVYQQQADSILLDESICDYALDTIDVWKLWARCVEQSVAVLHQRHTGRRLPEHYRGRCRWEPLVFEPPHRPLDSGRQDEYQPPVACTSVFAQQRVKQVRRLSTLLTMRRAFDLHGWHQYDSHRRWLHLQELWHAITVAPGYQRGWPKWLATNAHVCVIKVIKADKNLPKDQREWECPMCTAALPKQAKRARQLAVSAHRNAFHPEVDTPTWRGLMVSKAIRGRPKSAKVREQSKARGFAFRAKQFRTHNLVEVPANQKRAGKHRRPSEFWCVTCLTKLGGYGGGSRARQEKLTCAKTRKLPQAKQRANRAWKGLKNRSTVQGKPLRELLGSWIRNLLEDGDIEPNPGPESPNITRKVHARCV